MFLPEWAQVLAEASLNRVGELLNPWGNRVQLNCPDSLSSGSVHSKAKMDWLDGARDREKKASFRSRTVCS